MFQKQTTTHAIAPAWEHRNVLLDFGSLSATGKVMERRKTKQLSVEIRAKVLLAEGLLYKCLVFASKINSGFSG